MLLQLTMNVGALMGGGVNPDISFAGTTSGTFIFDGGAATLIMDNMGVLSATSGGSITMSNNVDLSINHLEAAGTINLDNSGDTTIETGTLVAGGDVVLTISGTLTIGDASGVAIDAHRA